MFSHTTVLVYSFEFPNTAGHPSEKKEANKKRNKSLQNQTNRQTNRHNNNRVQPSAKPGDLAIQKIAAINIRQVECIFLLSLDR